MNFRYNRSKVSFVYEADSLTVDIDLGFSIVLRDKRIRLHRIDSPHVGSDSVEEKKAACVAKDFVRQRLQEVANTVYIKTYKCKKYGQYSADVWLSEENAVTALWETTLNFLLLKENLVREFSIPNEVLING